MNCRCDESDLAFLEAMRSASFAVSDFDHRAHVRLAYVCLVRDDTESAIDRLRQLLKNFLASHGVDPARYHETLTRAWMLAVRHFMASTSGCSSAMHFIEAHPQLLDPRIMLSHYSEARLFSDAARARFLPADRSPIPLHDARS